MIRGRAIKGGGGGAGYYSRDDGGRESPGGWWTPESSLGVRDGDRVAEGDLRALMDGRNPETGASMVQQQRARDGEAGRMGGHDFGVSFDKSISVAYAAADESTRRDMRNDLRASIHDTLTEMHGQGAFETRQGKAGRERGPARDVAAAIVVHDTSRRGEPQLHAHVVVPNVARREDGRTGALSANRAYKMTPEAGQYCAERFAERLQARGFAMERVPGEPGRSMDNWRVAGSPRDLERAFSSRRAEMLRTVQERTARGSVSETGWVRARQMQTAAGATRERKPTATARERVEERWRNTMQRAGHTAERVRSAIREAGRGIGQLARGMAPPAAMVRGGGRRMAPWEQRQREHRKLDRFAKEGAREDQRVQREDRSMERPAVQRAQPQRQDRDSGRDR